ncbi:hypothetical protein M5K25_011657 [Dendrobium thyrsiflorum]|uniref:TNase-like domain-containing protein n=1 Tax=Dendrobium thyrsiflorum TaxID=117978 RepID=A0ABD0VAD3_DENTH
MAYGEEAKQVLVKMIQGKCLKIHVYNEDKYGRSVGDVYCNDIFIQEQLLKRGCVWHYVAYDRRPEFAKVTTTITWPEGITPPWADGVQFELLTLPVDKRAIGDGDGFTAYVSTTEPRELKLMPQHVKDAIIMRENARAANDFNEAKLIKKIIIDYGYR